MTEHRRDFLLLVAGALAWAAIGFATPRLVPLAANLENRLADIRLETLTPPEPRHPDIVIVTIEEETLEQFPYRSPLDRAFLAEAIDTLARYGVAALGIDILFDQPTEPAKDQALRRALHAFPALLVNSAGTAASGLTPVQLAFQADFLAGLTLGDASLSADHGGVVRWLATGKATPEGWRDGLAVALARGLGRLPAWTEGAVRAEADIRLGYRPPTPEGDPPFGYFPIDTLAFFPPASFAGKIVLIGANLALDDRHQTPYAYDFSGTSRKVPGVLIHAHMLAQLLDDRTPPDVATWGELAWLVLTVLVALLIVKADLGVWPKVGLFGVGLGLVWLAGFVVYLWSGPLLPLVAPSLAFAGTAGLGEALERRHQFRQKRQIRSALSRYVPRDVASKVADDPNWLSARNERREMSFIFTDIAGFTTLTESMSADELIPMLNRYLDGMSRIVLAHEGTLDKFIGDALVAFFNAPGGQPDHRDRAIRCALALDAYARAFSVESGATGYGIGATRIGVHSGEATVGNFGGDERFDYTAIGDTVNTAARLEGINKVFGTRVLISQATLDGTGGHTVRPVAEVVPKGKTAGIWVYEPVADPAGSAEMVQAYQAAFDKLRAGDDGALTDFARLREDYPQDTVIAFHHDRLRKGSFGTRIVMETK